MGGAHAQHLKPVRMAADVVESEAGIQRVGRGPEADAVGEQPVDHRLDVLGGEGLAEFGVAHAAARAERQLALLDVEACPRKEIVVPGVIVVQVRQDDVLDQPGLDADPVEPVLSGPHDRPAALRGHAPVEARIDHDRSSAAADHPDEVVDRHRAVVDVPADEVLTRRPVMIRVLDRVDLVGGRIHWGRFPSGGRQCRLRPTGHRRRRPIETAPRPTRCQRRAAGAGRAARTPDPDAAEVASEVAAKPAALRAETRGSTPCGRRNALAGSLPGGATGAGRGRFRDARGREGSMHIGARLDEHAHASPRSGGASPVRAALVALTAVAVLGATAAAVRAPAAAIDPDLARVMRFMALMKGGFALAAFAACLWRLARPAAAWRTAVYVVGPPLMAGGAIGLWALLSPALAAGALHLGLLAVLAAALTDADFLPDLMRRPRRLL
jgi:hypothetical protein